MCTIICSTSSGEVSKPNEYNRQSLPIRTHAKTATHEVEDLYEDIDGYDVGSYQYVREKQMPSKLTQCPAYGIAGEHMNPPPADYVTVLPH